MASRIEIDVEKRLGGFSLAVRFAADATGVIALFGASGAGKTSVIDMIAGLVRPDRGRIVVGDRVLFDSAVGIDRPPEARRAGYVFQDARLFPHLKVGANLEYGRRRALARRPRGLVRPGGRRARSRPSARTSHPVSFRRRTSAGRHRPRAS